MSKFKPLDPAMPKALNTFIMQVDEFHLLFNQFVLHAKKENLE